MDAGPWEDVHPEDGIADATTESYRVEMPGIDRPEGATSRGAARVRPARQRGDGPRRPALGERRSGRSARPRGRPRRPAAAASGDRCAARAPVTPSASSRPRRRGACCSRPGARRLVLLASDGIEVAHGARAAAGATAPSPAPSAEADAVVAYTRSEPLVERLAQRARRADRPRPGAARGRSARGALAGPGRHAARRLASSARAGPRRRARAGLHRGRAPGSRRSARAACLRVSWRFTRAAGRPRRTGPSTTSSEARAPARGRRPLAARGRARGAGARRAARRRSWPASGRCGVLGAALARAGLFLGNDAGVSHLAAATGAPTLALFGPTDPALVGARRSEGRRRCAHPAPRSPRWTLEAVTASGARLRSAASGLPSG